MKKICDLKMCTGCGTCYSICPRHCIMLKEDREGFIVPQIDTARCIDCLLCEKNCPVINANKQSKTQEKQTESYSYAVIANNRDMLARSSSGGVFGILAEIVLGQGGAVFGAAYDASFNVSQTMAETPDQIEKLQGSKYIQSSVNDSFIKTRNELENDRWVLYTGTPCQIAGLNSYLKKDYSNLITVDLLCHGVPNQNLFSEYIGYMEKKHKTKITSYSFRDKKKWGWGNWGSVCFVKPNGKKKTIYFPVDSDYFYSLYFRENCFRESCYVCPFAKLPRQGDFTIGDFWGAEQLFANMPCKNGVSLMLVNSQRAENMLCQMKLMAQIIPCELSKAINCNKTIVQATERPESRNTFYLDVEKLGFEAAAKRYCKISFIMPIVSRYLPRKLKKLIKLVLKKK